jgi:hypothetical protein
MVNRTQIRSAHSCATDPRDAVREFHAGVVQQDMSHVIFFCSSAYDLNVLAKEMKLLFGDVPVVGCTTAGEIGPAGYTDHSLAGVSFSAREFNIVCGLLNRLQTFEIATGHKLIHDMLQELESQAPKVETDKCFALVLIDGLSMREEAVTRTLQSALGRVPLVGGSAGDGEKFASTHVYFEGAFHPDSAIVILVATGLPFKLFKTQHFVATDQRLVVTEADPARRIVMEINGLPAAEEYARILGIDVIDLSPSRFAAWPVVVLIDATNYVRSIQKVNPDGSLTFFCAIENGLVLRVAKGVDLMENLEGAFDQIRGEMGPPRLVLGFDCILRKVEINQSHLKSSIGEIFLRNNTVGFNTYGEQFRGVHVNQTLVGVAIGPDATETSDA